VEINDSAPGGRAPHLKEQTKEERAPLSEPAAPAAGRAASSPSLEDEHSIESRASTHGV